MRSIMIAAAMGCLGTAHASAETMCAMEDWRSWAAAGDMLMIEGVATCDNGSFKLRLYDGTGEDRTFVGVSEAIISGGIFHAVIVGVEPPGDLQMEYTYDKGPW